MFNWTIYSYQIQHFVMLRVSWRPDVMKNILKKLIGEDVHKTPFHSFRKFILLGLIETPLKSRLILTKQNKQNPFHTLRLTPDTWHRVWNHSKYKALGVRILGDRVNAFAVNEMMKILFFLKLSNILITRNNFAKCKILYFSSCIGCKNDTFFKGSCQVNSVLVC